jgi:hypothetical protein
MDHSSFSNGDDFKTPIPPSQQEPSGPLAQIAMVLGIAALVFISCCTPLSFLLGIVGIVLACMSRKAGEAFDSKARIGLICSIVALALTVLMGLLFIMVFILTAQTGTLM